MKQIASAIGVLFIGSALFFGAGFLIAYVILDLAHLFDIPHLKSLSLWQSYGLTIVFSILVMKSKPRKSDDPEEDKIAAGVAESITGALNVLMIWGLCYLAKFLFV